jgi:hypothetical protein
VIGGACIVIEHLLQDLDRSFVGVIALCIRVKLLHAGKVPRPCLSCLVLPAGLFLFLLGRFLWLGVFIVDFRDIELFVRIECI